MYYSVYVGHLSSGVEEVSLFSTIISSTKLSSRHSLAVAMLNFHLTSHMYCIISLQLKKKVE